MQRDSDLSDLEEVYRRRLLANIRNTFAWPHSNPPVLFGVVIGIGLSQGAIGLACGDFWGISGVVMITTVAAVIMSYTFTAYFRSKYREDFDE